MRYRIGWSGAATLTGRPVFALGRASNGALVPSRGTLSVFTSDSREKVLATRVDDVKVAFRAALAMLLTGAVLTGGSAAALATMY